MDWTSKMPFSFDWETLALLNGEETEISKSAQELKSKIGSGIGMGNGSLQLSGGDMCSSSKVGSCSFKSSISASDSTSNAVRKIPELNFESVGGFLVNQNKNKDLARVDISETSPAVVSAEGTKEPVITLKLGKRTYFEDPCLRNNIKSSYFPASNPLSTTSVKKSRVYQQNLLRAYCQVEGCNIDLSTSKDYHRKHKVCESHSKSPKVVVAGQDRRFCQQCSRFHDLSEFDQKKRSCRRRLSDHNARRRKPQLETISFSSSKLSVSYYDDKQQANLVFGQSPFHQMTSIASSIWDGSGSLKLTQSEGSWRKSSETGSTNGQLLFPSNTNLNNAYTGHDMDSLLALKGTTAEILNQGLEATATFQSDGAPDLWRALSLLSTNKSRSPPITGYVNAARPEQPLLQVLPFESRSDGGRQLQESLLFKPFFGTGFIDTSHLS
ncbi:squamosa promoter-binding-like protein 12 isoform X1 [Musa acuminata AAA Group]|uniref:squamosa promoter-binding-like protein 12 isoform X1 n=2 Tax=Musa acuminata AAA Group TaxID=214697 RepID=UPI0031DC9411